MPPKIGRTALRLTFACLAVGLVLGLLGIDPRGVLARLGGSVAGIFDTLVSLVAWAVPYILAGAIVVVPIWLVLLLLRAAKRR